MTPAEFRRRAQSKYRRSAKGKAAQARYRQTRIGKQIQAACNARRIFVGMNYRGNAKTAALADAIKRHIGARLSELKQRLAHGEETEGADARQVPPQAAV